MSKLGAWRGLKAQFEVQSESGQIGPADGPSTLCSHLEDCPSTRRRRAVVCSRKKATETWALDRLQSREAPKNCGRPDERPGRRSARPIAAGRRPDFPPLRRL